jgi:agmatinase
VSDSPTQLSAERLDLPFTGLCTFLRSPVCTDPRDADADIAVIGFPSDEGNGWLPGARLGPRRLRELSLRFTGGMPQGTGHAGFYDIDTGRRYLDHELGHRRIVDCGDVDIIYTQLEQTWANATALVQATVEANMLPVVLGGDHAITTPIVAGLSEEVTVVQLDAHMDYQPVSHDVTRSHGNTGRGLSEMGHVRKVVAAGIRSFRQHQQDIEDSLADGNAVLSVNQLRARGPEALLEEIPSGSPVYVTIDLDSLDIALVPGVGTAEPDGFGYGELMALLDAVAREHEVVGFDLVELNPLLDSPNQSTAFLGAQIIVAFLGRCVEHPAYLAKHPRRA